MKKSFLLLLFVLFLWMPLFVSANTLTTKLDWYIEVINVLEYSKQDKILIALLNIEKSTPKKTVKSIINYLIERIEVNDPDATGKHINKELYDTYSVPQNLTYEYEFYSHDKPSISNWRNILLSPFTQERQDSRWRREVESIVEHSITNFPLTLIWEIRSDIEYVEIIWSGDWESYFLETYQPWSQEFIYRIDQKYGNIVEWLNKYLIRTYSKWRIFQSLYVLQYTNIEESNANSEYIVHRKISINDLKNEKQRSQCYKIKNSQEKKECFNRIEKEYTKSKDEACEMNDGSYKYNLEASWPWKKVTVSSFVKEWYILTYPVYIADWNDLGWSVSCESEWFQWSLFTYDCITKKSLELFDSQLHEVNRGGVCGIRVFSESEEYLIYKRSPNERHCGIYEWLSILDKKSWIASDIILFDWNKNSWVINNQKVLKSMQDVASEYIDINECFSPQLVGGEILNETLVLLDFRLKVIDDKEVRYKSLYDIAQWKFIIE